MDSGGEYQKNGARMRTHAKTLGCIALGLALAFQIVPMAQADEESFVRSAREIGLPFAPTNLKSIAQSACNMLSYNNRIPSEIEARIQRYTRVDPLQARQFFVLSVTEYCPQYLGVIGP